MKRECRNKSPTNIHSLVLPYSSIALLYFYFPLFVLLPVFEIEAISDAYRIPGAIMCQPQIEVGT
jgi:hypothetical protein